MFSNVIDAKRLLREVSILRQLTVHRNIVRLYDVIQPNKDNWQDFSELYYVFESCNTDLRKVVISTIPLQEIHVKVIVYQLLNAIAFLHSADVVHRDIKPSNILLNHDYTVKLCDLGLARHLADIVDPNTYIDDDTKALYGSFKAALDSGDVT